MTLLKALATLAVFVAIGIAGALAAERLTGGGTAGGYEVRAVFDNSSFVIPGEEVKVAGVTVGTIHAVQLTADNKAAVVLAISDHRFVPFRAGAHCEIGIESLLGEQFVQCTPGALSSPGAPAAAPLPRIRSGPGAGEHLLPVQDNTTPVGADLLADIQRLPQQQRFALIINGLGAGLAGNGQALNAALLRADPALQQTDNVIAVLAREDGTIAQLTDESDRVLTPLAAQRAHLGGFIDHAGTVAQASAQEQPSIEHNLADLPPFLSQLTPAADRLTNLAEQMTPALQALGAQAPAVDATTRGLGPLAKASIPALQTLGRVAQRGETVFPQVHRVALQLRALSGPLLPVASQLAAVASSFDTAGGIEDVMRFIYYYAGSVNGEDAAGHYIRSLVQLQGEQRDSSPVGGDGSTFGSTQVASAASVAAATTAASAARTARTTAPTTALLRYLLDR